MEPVTLNRTDLLPCPHCGRPPLARHFPAHQHHLVNFPDAPDTYTIECCGGMCDTDLERMVSHWNTRAHDKALLAQRDDAINRLQKSALANTHLMKQMEALTEQRDELVLIVKESFLAVSWAAAMEQDEQQGLYKAADKALKRFIAYREKAESALAKCGKDVS